MVQDEFVFLHCLSLLGKVGGVATNEKRRERKGVGERETSILNQAGMEVNI